MSPSYCYRGRERKVDNGKYKKAPSEYLMLSHFSWDT